MKKESRATLKEPFVKYQYNVEVNPDNVASNRQHFSPDLATLKDEQMSKTKSHFCQAYTEKVSKKRSITSSGKVSKKAICEQFKNIQIDKEIEA